MTSSSSSDYPEPLVSAIEAPDWFKPIIEFPIEKYRALSIAGTKRANGAPGEPEKHIRGICGEYAVAKLLGISDQVDTDIYEYGDGGFDLKLGDKIIDVKTAGPHVSTPSILTDPRKEVRADYYVLVQQVGQTAYKILGYAPAPVVEDAYVLELSRDEYTERVRTVEQHDLFPLLGPSLHETWD